MDSQTASTEQTAQGAVNFAEVIARQAERLGPETLYTFLDSDTSRSSLSYTQLSQKTAVLAKSILDHTTRGERALILCSPGLGYIEALFGCFHAGVIAVPAYPPHPRRPDERLKAVVDDCAPAIVIADATTADRLTDCDWVAAILGKLQWVVVDDVPAGDSGEAAPLAPTTPRDVAFLQYTSGSTGRPKGVRVTHGNLVHNSGLIAGAFGHSASSRGAIWLPPYHDMGLIGGILQPAYVGFPVTLMSPFSFLQRPLRWLRAISETGATTSGGPTFAFDLCTKRISPEERDTLDLSRWEVAFCGAEPVRAEVLDAFADYFEPAGFRREAFYPCYGLAEATLIVSGGDKLAPLKKRRLSLKALAGKQVVDPSDAEEATTLVGCGNILQNLDVRIVNPDSATIEPEGGIGEIWLKGPSVAEGYWHPDAEGTFEGRLTDCDEGGFMRTGDLGFLDAGELYIAGRIKDMFIIAGKNCYPQDIEYTIESNADALGLSAAAAFAVNLDGEERLVLAVEQSRGQRDDPASLKVLLRRLIWDAHALSLFDLMVLGPRGLPRTSSGKVRRFACRDQYLLATQSASDAPPVSPSP